MRPVRDQRFSSAVQTSTVLGNKDPLKSSLPEAQSYQGLLINWGDDSSELCDCKKPSCSGVTYDRGIPPSRFRARRNGFLLLVCRQRPFVPLFLSILRHPTVKRGGTTLGLGHSEPLHECSWNYRPKVDASSVKNEFDVSEHQGDSHMITKGSMARPCVPTRAAFAMRSSLRAATAWSFELVVALGRKSGISGAMLPDLSVTRRMTLRHGSPFVREKRHNRRPLLSTARLSQGTVRQSPMSEVRKTPVTLASSLIGCRHNDGGTGCFPG